MKYSVLIVDDNLTNLRLAASVLSPYYKLLIADGGESAIKIAETSGVLSVGSKLNSRII